MTPPSEVELVIAEGRTAHPGVGGDLTRIRAALAERLDGEEVAVADLDAGELYLAAACAQADPVALATFERLYFGTIGPALSRMGLPSDAARDIAQTLRIRLFVAEEGELPRVVTYAGRGQLGALVRVAAVREGLTQLRAAGRLVHDADGLEDLPERTDDPELQKLKQQHRVAFKAAFEAAAGELEPKQRTLLRHAIVEQLGIDRIGALYGVHRATAARWVSDARAELSRGVHRHLALALRLDAEDIDDLAMLVESQLELSIARLLKSDV